MSLKYRSFTSFCVLLVFTLVVGNLLGYSQKPLKPEYVPGKLLVKFREGVDEERIQTIVGVESGTISSVLKSSGIYIIEVPADADIQAALDRFSAYHEVLYAEPVLRATPLEDK